VPYLEGDVLNTLNKLHLPTALAKPKVGIKCEG